MPQDAGHAFYPCAMTAPMSLFYTFGRNINDSHYYYYYYYTWGAWLNLTSATSGTPGPSAPRIRHPNYLK